MNNRFQLTILTLVILTILNCTGGAYTGFYFAYPINTKPHDENAQYIGKVIVHEKGRLSKNRNYEIRITIQDRQKKVLLDDKKSISEANIYGKAEWKEFEKLILHIYRVNSPSDVDELAQLSYDSIPSKFNEINAFIYQYDSSKKLFEYMEAKASINTY